MKSTVTFNIRERLGVSWPRTLCHFNLASRGIDPFRVRSAAVNGRPVPFQTSPSNGLVGLFMDLSAYSRATVAFSLSKGVDNESIGGTEDVPGRLSGTWLGPALLPPLGEKRFDPPADSLSVPPPVRAIRTIDGRVVGSGWLDTYERVVSMSCEMIESGPLWTTVRVRYAFDSGASFTFEATSAKGEDFLRVREEA